MSIPVKEHLVLGSYFALENRCWDPEDESFWQTYGEKIAFKTLSVSTPNLTLMFATWLMWSIVAALIQGAHDKDPTVHPKVWSNFETGQLFSVETWHMWAIETGQMSAAPKR